MSMIQVALSSLDVADRLRQVDPEEAKRMALSLAEVGQLQPIAVTAGGDEGRYRLVIGAHRVAAATLLGWTELRAEVLKGTADALRLREIDENLYRRELSPYDQAAFLAERRDVCQRLGLLQDHGGDRRSDQSAKLALRSYEAELANKFGISRRVLFRALRRRSAIVPSAWQRIEGTVIADQGACLDALAGLPAGAQLGVVEAYFAPGDPGAARPSFTALCKAASGVRRPKLAAARKRRLALQAAWRAADKDDMAWFVEAMRPAKRGYLTRLLNGDLADG